MKTKKVDKKKTLAYAVAFYFTDVSVKFMMGNAMYEYVHTVYDRRYDNGGFNTLAVVYNYKRMKYEVLVVSDEMLDVALDRAMLDDYSLYVYLSDASVE